jgi:uncharacterized repeat protein (TIGR03803 family)
MTPSAWKMVPAVLALCAATAIAAPAQTFTTLANFDGTNGATPSAALAQGTDGALYGTTSEFGVNGYGTVFRITSRGTLTTLHNFDSTDGAYPGGLVLATDENFYGETENGGVHDEGTAFKITRRGTLTTLYIFGSDGILPRGGLVQATDGNLYGTTYQGGSGANCDLGCGTVFKMTPGGTLTTLLSFEGNNGNGPNTPLVQATDGNLYGTTVGGGAHGTYAGTIFKLAPDRNVMTVYSFCAKTNCTDGEAPDALFQATDGNLYGTTATGGSNFNGTVFRVSRGGLLTTLYSFCGQTTCTDGYLPRGLVQATDGNFYGTTQGGGDLACQAPIGCGTVFKLTPGGTLTTLHSFHGSDGLQPPAGLLQATNGSFYGTTFGGGASGLGTIFSLSTGLGPFVAFVRPAAKVGQTGGILGQGSPEQQASRSTEPRQASPSSPIHS